jgi:hypothetical protein
VEIVLTYGVLALVLTHVQHRLLCISVCISLFIIQHSLLQYLSCDGFHFAVD